MVGAVRFELTTPCAQGRCATRLRYAPTGKAQLILNHFSDLHLSSNARFLVQRNKLSKLFQNRIKLTVRQTNLLLGTLQRHSGL